MPISRSIQPLFDPVVAGDAKRLPVALIPEQRLIAAMRGAVIDHGRECIAEGAEAVTDKVGRAGLLPLVIIAALTGRGPGCIMPCIASAG